MNNFVQLVTLVTVVTVKHPYLYIGYFFIRV